MFIFYLHVHVYFHVHVRSDTSELGERPFYCSEYSRIRHVVKTSIILYVLSRCPCPIMERAKKTNVRKENG